MLTISDVERLAAAGESERVEFKASTAEMDTAMRTVAGMANQAGGIVLFGVKPDGLVAGQEASERTLEKLAAQVSKIAPTPICSISRVPIGDHLAVVAVEVDAGPLRPYRLGGKAYLRTGAVTRVLSDEQGRRMLLDAEHTGQRWEDMPSGFDIDELEADEIRRTIDAAIRRGRIEPPDTTDLVDLLRGLHLLDRDDRPLNAAAVLFGTDAALQNHRLTQCQLKVARFLGTSNSAPMNDDHQRVGNLFSLYYRADQFLIDHIRISAVVPKDSWIRVDTPEIPPPAMREAVLNALAHRDYSMWQASTTVGFFDDRVEVTSPGSLHFGLTPSDLYGRHASAPWNPRIARVLHQRGLIETWGTGFNKMVDAVRAAGLVIPLVEEIGSNLVVTFTRPGWAPQAYKHGLDDAQKELLDALFGHGALGIAEAERLSGRPRRSLQRDFRVLADRGVAQLDGQARSARWVPSREWRP